jgi:transposase
MAKFPVEIQGVYHCVHASLRFTRKRSRGFCVKREAEVDGEYRVATRLHAVVLNAEGRTSGEKSSVLKATRSCVAEWLRSFEELGFEGILEDQRTGRPSGLSADEKAELADIIDSGPVAYGFLSGIWDSPMIAKVIVDEFSVIYKPRHLLRILDDLNFSEGFVRCLHIDSGDNLQNN